MKWGLSSFAYPYSIGVPPARPEKPMDAFQLLEMASQLELSVVQIADNLPLHHCSIKEREEIKKYAQSLGITIEVGTRGLLEENIERYLEIAKELESPILRVVINTQSYQPNLKTIKETIDRLLPKIEMANSILAIENHDSIKSLALKEIMETFSDSNHLGVCLDTVNSFGALEGPAFVIENLSYYTASLHVKDFYIQRNQNQMGFTLTGAPAGQGMLDLPWALKQLTRSKYSFCSVLELWIPPEDTIEKTIEKEKEWVVDSIHYLKSLEITPKD